MLTAKALTSANVRTVRAQSGPELWLYDEIGYWGVAAKDVATLLEPFAGERVTVRVNSPGGEVFDGIAILNLLRHHDGGVDVVVDGLAASAASFIAMAGQTITMRPNSRMMIHDAIGFAYGNAADMLELASLLDDLSQNIAEVYAARSGGDPAAFRELMLAETWLSPAQAVDLGLADAAEGDAPAEESDDEEKPAAPADLLERWEQSATFRASRVSRGRSAEPVVPAARRTAPPAPPAPVPAPSPIPPTAVDAAAVLASLRGALA